MPRSSTTGPLRDEVVLDISTTIAGAYCAKLLGDLGADVVKVEAPLQGDPLRATGPFPDGREGDPEASAAFLYFNSTKRGVTLDLDDAGGRERLLALVAQSGIVVADGPDGELERRGIGDRTLRSANPDVIVTTLSPFGGDGPYAARRADHLVLSAMGGWSYACGLPDDRPLQTGGSCADTVSGAYAAVATVGAVLSRARHGAGDHVDVSGWEAAITCALGPNPLLWEYRQEKGNRNSRVNTGPSFLIECGSGGYIGVNVLTERQWETLCLFIDRPDLLADPRFADAYHRTEHVEELEAAVAAALAHRDAWEVFQTSQEWRLPFGLVASPAQALELNCHQEREYFVEVEQPGIGTLRTPRVPFLLPACPSSPYRSPRLGEHDDEVFSTDGRVTLGSARRPLPPAAGQDDVTPPLAGLRLVDFTQFQAGTMASLIAADLGAEVIKIEAIQRIDGWRGTGRIGSRPWETSGLFNWVNRNKLGITLNLTDPRGADIARSLVAGAGAVAENYTPRVMANFGLDFESLRAITPDLVMLSMPGFGLEGTWRDFAAFAWTTEELATICHLTGYEGGGPLFTGTTFGDPLAGLMGALALLSALRHRDLTGEGQHIDLSQVEAATSYVADAIIAAQITDEPTRRGNRSDLAVPHNTYRCADDRWLAISCTSDADWACLWRLLQGSPDAAVPYPTLDERRAAEGQIDASLDTLVADRDAFETMHLLQRHGVAAGVVMTGPDMLDDPHLAARGFFIEHEREEVGVRRHPAQPFRYRRTALRPPARAPYLGEHNHEVLCGLLGLSESEYAQLERDRVIGTSPAD